MAYLQEGIVGHTMSDDCRAASYLNSKGVY